MSFITKRERVFNEYDLFDLPARNEGKLKAYASCTDARAWSHFGSDQTEHLVDIIKRNNDTCRPKYVPTDVIVDTLMVAKNAEITRLKRKIEEFEQMLAAYDQLDLTCEQKCEMANAHAAIKAANKELDDMFLDLDLSGFTEGIESDTYETGKSRGDEPGRGRADAESAKFSGDGEGWVGDKEPSKVADSKSIQAGLQCACDASTNVTDPRIQEMKEALINKDAKLGAMQNTIAVMENDVCEPYCIYAHIYTALEKIFGILCQNDKYKLYLSLMTAGKDTRCVDIKGKILFKLKVFEKFCQALIAPCSQETHEPSSSQQDCSCYRTEIVQQMVPTPAFALTSSEAQPTDNRRAKLVADIMQNDEMKEILSKESFSQNHDERFDDVIEEYDIESENLSRLKSLQENYDDLMTCYENLKHEKEQLLLKCQKFEELDQEYTGLRNQLREYNLLWNEKEHYRKRSADLDSLKEKFIVLSDETSAVETQLKAESEINKIKANTIDELRKDNIALEQKVNDALIAFEKEKSFMMCKLQEAECKCMCQEQQIKSLSVQIDRLLEQEPEKTQTHGDPAQSLMLINEIESLKEQIKNLKDALCCNEEEKLNLHEEFQKNLKTINDLKLGIEEWKSSYEKIIHRNNYLENYAQNFEEELNKLLNENEQLSKAVEDKSKAIEDKSLAVSNLINVINNKSQEINKLLGEVEVKENQNNELRRQLHDFTNMYESNISSMENEKKEVLESLTVAKKESAELLNKLKDYDLLVENQSDLQAQIDNCHELKKALLNTIEENNSLQMDLQNREKSNSFLLNEIQKLQEKQAYAFNNIKDLDEEKNKYKTSLELTRKKSEILETQLSNFEALSRELQNLRDAHETLLAEKNKLEKDLREAKYRLEDALHSTELTKKESKELKEKLFETDNLTYELSRLNDAYQSLMREKLDLYKELSEKNKELSNLQKSFEDMLSKNNILLQKSNQIPNLERRLAEIEKSRNDLEDEKRSLLNDLDKQSEEINNLYNTLEAKIEENRHLLGQLTYLQNKHKTVKTDLADLQNENVSAKASIAAIRKESDDLLEKLKHYENLEKDYEKLRQDHKEIKLDNERLQTELNSKLTNLNKFQQENNALQRESQTLMRHSEDLENALVDARTQLIENRDHQDIPYLTIKNEIKELKKEKLKNIERIRDLSNELDVMENIVSNLTQDVSARDDKISILENHINKLKDEVTRLHGCLTEVINTGEQLKSTSYEKIDQSLKNMEAHHSKATHNMKLELAKLHNEKLKLEAQMSLTKLKTEESIRDGNKCRSQLVQLQNEREIIVTDIKQLELQSIGDSLLSPNHCDVEDILGSLDRIRQYIDAKNSKNNSLEQALMKVQRSSQVLVSEAKDLVEKEKQKILNEKEEAVRDKQHLQKQLDDQKSKLEAQIADAKNVIKDLEAEVLNQKLIIGKINASTASYISKLEDELNSLQSLYQNTLAKVSELQEKIANLSEQSNNNMAVINQLKEDLKQKSDEIVKLQNELAQFKNKRYCNMETQTENKENKSTTSVQTDKIDVEEHLHAKESDLKHNNHKIRNNNLLEILPKQRPHSINEVQILTANVEPTFDFVKSSYLNYKIKQLSMGRLEQQSISNDEASIQEDGAEDSRSASNDTEKVPTDENAIVDLYNRKSMQTFSSIPGTSNSKTNKDTTGTSLYDGSELIESLKMNGIYTDATVTKTTKTEDKDLFVIYRESGSDLENKLQDVKGLWNVDKKSEILVDVVKVESPKKGSKKKKKEKVNKDNDIQIDRYNINNQYTKEKSDEEDDDSVKPKLKINLPRVPTDSASIPTTSEGDRKSIDSYTMAIYLSPKERHSDNKIKLGNIEKTISQETPSLPTLSNDEHRYTNSNSSFKIPVHENKNTQKNRKQVINDDKIGSHEYNKISDKSFHKLSRVEADVLLIKPRENQNKKMTRKPNKDYGLQYILDVIQKENENEFPDTISNTTDKTIYKSHSDTTFQQDTKILESNNPRNIINNSWSPSKISDSTRCRPAIDRTVLAKIDNSEDYEAKIRSLTKALENVEKDCKMKIEAIKIQYDSNIKSIINEHNTGVKSIQNLHEETLQDIIKIHENEVENLRTLSIEAMRKSEILEKENKTLKSKIPDVSVLEVEPTRISCDCKKRRKSRADTCMLTKTNVEAFNVRPKAKCHGPCTCSLDINLSDTIRNIFEQVDIDQRKMAENTYMKYIANKILSTNVEALDAQELSFLHLKVCRTWKMKLTKEEALQKKIDTLEHELMSKQRNAQQHIAELDRKVAEERRRLQEVREAVCRSPPESRSVSPVAGPQTYQATTKPPAPPTPPPTAAEKELLCRRSKVPIVPVFEPQDSYKGSLGCNRCGCNSRLGDLKVCERLSAGDLVTPYPTARPKRPKESNRAVLARLDAEEKRDKKPYHDEPPTRLRRAHPMNAADRHRAHKK